MLIKQYYVVVKINEEGPHLPMWLNLPNTGVSKKKNSIAEGYTQDNIIFKNFFKKLAKFSFTDTYICSKHKDVCGHKRQHIQGDDAHSQRGNKRRGSTQKSSLCL